MKTYAGTAGDEEQELLADRHGRIVGHGKLPVADIEAHLEGKHEFELVEDEDDDSEQVPVAIVGSMFLAGRERYRAQVVPNSWYRTDRNTIAQVLHCISFATTTENNEGHSITVTHSWVECTEHEVVIDPNAGVGSYPVLEPLDSPAFSPAAFLLRPEHVLGVGQIGTLVDASSAYAEQLILNEFYLK